MKKPDLNKPGFNLPGMTEAVVDIILGDCPFCKKKVYEKDFKDALSKKEYGISGLCQVCQDSVFGGEE
jgi:hypothetical protein